MTLNLTTLEVIYLEVLLEREVSVKREIGSECDSVESILKKIYEISSTEDRKFPELIK